jgi:hypothetical protein
MPAAKSGPLRVSCRITAPFHTLRSPSGGNETLPGATISDVPFAVPTARLNIVTVGSMLRPPHPSRFLELARHLRHGTAEAHAREQPLRRLVSLGGQQDDAWRAARRQVCQDRV